MTVLWVLILGLIAFFPASIGPIPSAPEELERQFQLQLRRAFNGASYLACLRYSKGAANACESLDGCVERGLADLSQKIKESDSPDERARLYEELGDLASFSSTRIVSAPDAYKNSIDILIARSRPKRVVEAVQFKKAAAELRFGELQNCQARHNSDSCIFPLRRRAVHDRVLGSSKAIETLSQIWKSSPGHPAARWLLNVAYMTLGKYPDAVPKDVLMPPGLFRGRQFPRFPDVAIESNASFLREEGGALLEDVNADGFLDIILTSRGFCDPVIYLENDGAGLFSNRSKSSGLAKVRGASAVTQGDFDNDGHIDLLFTRGAWQSPDFPEPPGVSLWRNLGAGQFKEVTKGAGLHGFSAAVSAATWLDADLDGFLDIAFCNEDQPVALFHGDGRGKFTNISLLSGLNGKGICKTLSVGDIDGDGRPDVFIGNYLGEKKVFLNRGPLGFREIFPFSRHGLPARPLVSWIFDANNDGVREVFMAEYSPNLWLYADALMGAIPGDGRGAKIFSEISNDVSSDLSASLKLPRLTMAMSGGMGDLNNDGFLDFFLGGGGPNLVTVGLSRMYLNEAGKKFSDISFASGFSSLQKTHGVAFGDVNGDGYPEVLVSHGGVMPSDRGFSALHKNPGRAAFSNNWISLSLEGRSGNRSAIGASVEATIIEQGRTRKVFREVSAASGYIGNPLRITIGLGTAREVQSLIIRWPAAGARQVLHHLKANQFLKIVEGQR